MNPTLTHIAATQPNARRQVIVSADGTVHSVPNGTDVGQFASQLRDGSR